MRPRSTLFLWLLAACAGGNAELSARDSADAGRLTGAWDVVLTLERPYPLSFRDPAARRVCGTIGFVDESDDGVRQSAGVYDLDLSKLGLNWLNDTRFPAAIAIQSDSGRRISERTDSVAITLNPESQEHIVLLGLYRVATIDGSWTAQSPRGTASGVFTLRQHQSGARTPTC